MFDLSGKVALVTAGTRGIGLACVRMLAEQGAVVYIAARNEEAGNAVATNIVERGGTARFIHFDAERREDYASVVDDVAQAEGRAGHSGQQLRFHGRLPGQGSGVNGDTDAFFRIVQSNVQSVYLTCKQAVPHMKTTGGSIINISSIVPSCPI